MSIVKRILLWLLLGWAASAGAGERVRLLCHHDFPFFLESGRASLIAVISIGAACRNPRTILYAWSGARTSIRNGVR